MAPRAVTCSLRYGHLDLAQLMSGHLLCKGLSKFFLLVALKAGASVSAVLLAITRGLQSEKPSCLPHDVKSQKFLLKPDMQQHNRDL